MRARLESFGQADDGNPRANVVANFIQHLSNAEGWDAKRGLVAWLLLCLEIWWDRYRSKIRLAGEIPIAAPAMAGAGIA